MNLIKKYWPILTLLILNLVMVAANYKPDTYLIGWDNLMPELNFGVNIQRSFFAVWQEYQSLGLLGGMGHATDLPRQLFLLATSLILPASTIRYFWTFLTLFLGGLGTYFLTKFLLKKDDSHTINGQILLLVAAVFYTLNLATIQTYFAVFETFSGHFASLPWIILATLLFLKSSRFKNYVFLSIVFLLSIPSFYVPTIFVVVILSLSIIGSVIFLLSEKRVLVLKRLAIIFATILVINLYWLAPFAFYTFKNGSTNITAKINQMATETIFLQNKEFGTAQDVALLKGYSFNSIDPDINGNNAFMLASWRDHFNNPVIPAIGFLLFAVILIGFISCFTRQNKEDKKVRIALAVLFLFAFTMLATATPPFSIIDELFRKLPLVNQAFRFPFTKFSLLAGLMFSLMLALGLSFLQELLGKLKPKVKHVLIFTVPLLAIIAIFAISLPVFKGNLIYSKERLVIPNEYFQTFEYFKKEDQNARIANLPQPAFWGWTNYSWGAGGSGFLWYAIKQPILDRAFDVWSQNSENYYFELSDALYSKDPEKLENILNKYQVSYILFDENVIYPSSPKSLQYDETETMLESIPSVKLDKTFGKIKIYKVKLKDNPKSFVFTLPANLPTVNQPYWKTSDEMYSTYGNYISGNNFSRPFGSLFSQKTDREQDFVMKNNQNSISISTKVELEQSTKINIPSYVENESIIPIKILASSSSNGVITISGFVDDPAANISIDGRNIIGTGRTLSSIFTIKLPKPTFPINININGVSNFVVNKNSPQEIGTAFLTTQQDNTIAISSKDFINFQTVKPEDLKLIGETTVDLPKGNHELAITIPKIDDSYSSYIPKLTSASIDNCGGSNPENSNKKVSNIAIVLSSVNSTLCSSFFSPTLFHDSGLAMFVMSKNIQGRPFHFWILNEDQKHVILDAYLDGKNDQNFVLPTQEKSGIGYSFHFDNVSIGNDKTENELNSFEAYPIPYNWIQNITLGITPSKTATSENNVESVSHPNESLYIVKLKESTNSTLALSQSYDPGWHAYIVTKPNLLSSAFPFIFGKEIKQHVELNSWENAWVLVNTNGSSVIIVYLPQYLEYTGFAILILFVLFLIYKSVHKRFV